MSPSSTTTVTLQVSHPKSEIEQLSISEAPVPCSMPDDSSQQSETPSPPDRHAIEIVIAGFVANFMVWGIAFTFGVFQEFYTSTEGPLYHSSPAVVSMIGTVASATTYCVAIFNNYLTRRLNCPRNVMLTGTALMSLGLFLASLAKEGQIYQFILSQGLLFGIGSSLLYSPPVVCAPPYFTRHRGVALGILFSGTGIGALAIAPFSQMLITKLGWRWALRVLGFCTLTISSVISFMVHQHPSLSNDYKPISQMFNYKVVDLYSLLAQLGAGFFQSAGYLICLNYMSTYGLTLGFSARQGAYFIAMNNGINALFKILIGHLADKTGRLNMIVACSFSSAASVFALWMVTIRPTFIAFVVIYGVVSGAIVSLLPTCLVQVFGVKNYQSISGLMYFCRGLGNLAGSPIAGLLIRNQFTQHQIASDYRNAIIYNGSLLSASTALLLYLRIRVAAGLQEKRNV